MTQEESLQDTSEPNTDQGMVSQETGQGTSTIAENKSKAKRKKHTVVPDHISVAMENLDELKKGLKDKNEFDYFGINIAHQFRALPLKHALNYQTMIQHILMRQRIDYVREKSLSSRSSHTSAPLLSPVSSLQSPLYEEDLQQESCLISQPESSSMEWTIGNHNTNSAESHYVGNSCAGFSVDTSNDILSQAIGTILTNSYD